MELTWFGYLLIVLYLVNIFLTVATIGKPRPPRKPLESAISVLLLLLMMVGVLFVGTGTF